MPETDSAGHAVKGKTDIVQILVGAKPVVPGYPVGDEPHFLGHYQAVFLQFPIDLINEIIDRYRAETLPVTEQVMIVEDIQSDAGKAPSSG